jgi:hypothetical protein
MARRFQRERERAQGNWLLAEVARRQAKEKEAAFCEPLRVF